MLFAVFAPLGGSQNIGIPLHLVRAEYTDYNGTAFNNALENHIHVGELLSVPS